MATARPVCSVFNFEDGKKSGHVTVPTVMQAPLRPDLVRYVHSNMAKNRRQAYAVTEKSGYQHSAESWGTGRAVSRIPRVSGSGTHAASAGAFGNMCRGGGMFAPTKTWRRWHRKVNVTQKRHAVASALAAAALPALVMARGHKIDNVPELPLVVSDGVELVKKTGVAASVLSRIGLDDELAHVKDSRKVRCGSGKQRNRRYVQRRGPLVVYANDEGISKAFRNIPGVDLCSVDRLNLLQLAPGGTFGRLCVFSEAAMAKLQKEYGTYNGGSAKKGYTLPRAAMTNADVARIINSDAIQAVVAPAKEGGARTAVKKNALKNKSVKGRVCPGANARSKAQALEQQKGTKANAAVQAKKAKTAKSQTARSKQARDWFRSTMAQFDAKPEAAEEE